MVMAVKRGISMREVARRFRVALGTVQLWVQRAEALAQLTSIFTPCVAESQPGNLFFVKSLTHSQDGGSTSDQEVLSLVKERTLR